MWKLTIVPKRAVFYMQLANHCNITLSKETLPLLNPLGDFEHDGLQNAPKFLNISAC